MNLREAAEFLVSLTTSDQKKALVSAALARKSLAGVTEQYLPKAEALWEAANKEALDHLRLVLGNNPHKSPEEILKRPDVQSALQWPYEQAAKASEALLREAWEKAELETVKHAKGEVKLLNLDWKGYEVDSDVLESLVEDLHANAKDMRARYRKALTKENGSREDNLSAVGNDARRRASYSLSVAVWSCGTTIRNSIAQLLGLNKMWLSRMDSTTCTECKGLHGVVVGPGESFPVGNLRTYKGLALLGPPRHPNCRCIVVFTTRPKTKNKKTRSKS